MANDKNSDFEASDGNEDAEFMTDTSSRARNRTVMLTPEITGEVRARLQQDMGKSGFAPAPGGVPPATASPGAATFAPPVQHSAPSAPASSYIPAGNRIESSVRPGTGAAHAPTAAHPPSSSSSGGFQPARPAPRPAPAPAADEYAVWDKEGRVIGFLVSYGRNPNGSVFELRVGRMIVTSEAPGHGNFLVVNDKSVSPMHAIMRISEEAEIQVLDQLSEFGTKILRGSSGEEEELSGDKSGIEHGDKIWFGERKFYVCLISRGEDD